MTAVRQALVRVLDSRSSVYAACGLSLALGLAFVFVWAPHPWGWAGIDYYHVLAQELARGEPFSTTDVPWGYAYFVAFWYWLSGETLWVPLVAQVVANAAVPLLLYHLVAPLGGHRTAVMSALLAGVLSFNTVYASTQASDAICTVLFTAALLLFARGFRSHSAVTFAVAGLLSGLAPQFRPNLILLPGLAAAVYVAYGPRSPERWRNAVLYLAVVAVALAPWTIRNYRLTGLVLPTSTHGGQQLWYGSLQTGPHLESQSYNPRRVFEFAGFGYTSLIETSIVISADATGCIGRDMPVVELIYWTDRNPQKQRRASRATTGRLEFELPGQPADTAVYYYFEGRWTDGGATVATPLQGEAAPYVTFVSSDHLGDLDRHGDLLDLFDLVRLMRTLAWREALPYADRLDLNGDGQTNQPDLAAAVAALIGYVPQREPPAVQLDVSASRAMLKFPDGSTLSVPRTFTGRITDLEAIGELAGNLVSKSRSFAAIVAARAPSVPHVCHVVDDVRVNDVYYRKEPHRLNRYTALAFDNIGRAPVDFAMASAYRLFRMFIIRGTDDISTAQQFSSSRLAYGAGQALSTLYFVVFLCGVVIACRRRSALVGLLLPIAYVPLTICFVLTNMRYTVTVQPLMFVFVGLALLVWLRLDRADDDER